MRVLALIALVLVAPTTYARTGRFERTNSRTPQGRSADRGFMGEDLAFFEFAPASGAGMGTACACTTPTGAKGEALTFTRGSSATCTKTPTGGLATTGIANGDLVTCSTNQPRVEYDSAGVLGLLVESARTNSALRSQEIDNAAWTKTASGSGSVPTVTPNYGIAPDGTQTADRVQVSACPGAPSSSEVSINTGVGNAVSSLYVRGVSGNGTIRLCQYSTGNCATANYTTTWQRVVTTQGGAGGTYLVFGCLNSAIYSGYADTGAADVLVWGAQHEAGAYVTSYIPTTSAAATRQADTASMTSSVSLSGGLSWAASTTHPGTNGAVWASALGIVQDATNRTQLYRIYSNTAPCGVFSASGNITAGESSVVTPFVARQTYRQACSYTGAGASSTVSNYLGGALVSTSAAGTTSAVTGTTLCLGALGPTCTGGTDGVVSRLCVDPNPERCR